MAEPLTPTAPADRPRIQNPDHHTAIWAGAGEIEGDAITLESIQYVIATLTDEASK